jgi:hypothetical protein
MLLTYHVVQSRILRMAPVRVTTGGDQANIQAVVSNQQLPKSIEGAEKLFRITNDKSTVSLRFFPDTGPTKRADALLLIIYGYKLLLGIDSVKQSVATFAVNEALASAPNSPVPHFIAQMYSVMFYDQDYGLEYVRCGFLEVIGLSKGGFYRLTPDGETRAEQMAKDSISRA